MRQKNILFTIILFATKIYGQLSGTALALYNECYNADVPQGIYATNNGVQVVGTADGKSFYLKWLPAGATASLTPMLVTLHGSGGRAFIEFFNWHAQAQAKGVGIIALQWYKGAASNSYFNDDTIYNYIKTALTSVNYPSNKVLYHGFSRGSARSYAIAFKDLPSQGGNNYFCTIMSNAGKPDSLYPLYSQINAGTFGHTFFTGKKWGMYCGADDNAPSQSGCPAMINAQNWVIANGGTVGLYISGPSPQAHDGFHTQPAYVDSCLNYYLQCYNATTSITERNTESSLSIYPNPANAVLNFKLENESYLLIEITNVFGKVVLSEKTMTHSVSIASLNTGIYFLSVKTQSGAVAKVKFIKE